MWMKRFQKPCLDPPKEDRENIKEQSMELYKGKETYRESTSSKNPHRPRSK